MKRKKVSGPTSGVTTAEGRPVRIIRSLTGRVEATVTKRHVQSGANPSVSTGGGIRIAFGMDVDTHDVIEWHAATLIELRQLLRRHPSSARGGAYTCASGMRDGIRRLEHATSTRVLIVDFDKLTPAAARALAAALTGIASLWWETRKSTRQNPRLRVIALIDQDIEPQDYARVHAALVAELSRRAGINLVADPTSANPAQPQFTPTPKAEVHLGRGEPFALSSLDRAPESGKSTFRQLKFEAGNSRNVDLTSVAGWLRFRGCTAEQIRGALEGINATLPKPLDAREVTTIARSIGKYAPNIAFSRLVVEPLSNIPVEHLQPLWPGRLWLGKITVVAGLMGIGKSTLLFAVAAIVTAGGQWPDGSGSAPLGDVIILSTEDAAADTIRPRLEVMGADVSRVHIIQGVEEVDSKTKRSARRLFSLRQHLELLDQKLAELTDVRLVIIDPITGVFQGSDTHKTADVREVLAMVNAVVERHRAAFVGISHPNKAEGTSAAYRITGSLAFAAGPRSVFIVGRSRNPSTPDRVVLAELKNNLAIRQNSLAFRVIGKDHPVAGNVAAIEWLGTADETPDDILDPGRGSRSRGVGERTEAAASWLKELLATGPVAADRVMKEAKNAQISRRQLQRAEQALKVAKAPKGRGGIWMWTLPPSTPK